MYSQNWERLVKLFTFVGREAGKISETRDIEEPWANFKYENKSTNFKRGLVCLVWHDD